MCRPETTAQTAGDGSSPVRCRVPAPPWPRPSWCFWQRVAWSRGDALRCRCIISLKFGDQVVNCRRGRLGLRGPGLERGDVPARLAVDADQPIKVDGLAVYAGGLHL